MIIAELPGALADRQRCRGSAGKPNWTNESGRQVMNLMPIERIGDWEKRLERVDAFWDQQLMDRAVINITFPAPERRCPWPARKTHATLRERWMDAEYVADWSHATALNTEHMGDALPAVNPNLGPEVFSAFFGAELEYGETTSWSVPNLKDWSDADSVQFSDDNVYWKKLLEITDALLAKGQDVFYTGITDLHPGGDAIVAFRDPINMNIDMIEHVEDIKRLLKRINQAYFRVFDFFYDKLTAAEQACTNWTRITSTRKHYVPSNDFSCMISKAMFDDVFLPGLIEECRHMEASIYHLDGPGAIHHLDSLISIKELNAIQWVCGAGKGPALKWLDLHKRIQAAGKSIQILDLRPSELGELIENLAPEGLWLDIVGVQSREEAEAIINRVARWR
jgi:hypothetical protein